MLALLSFLWCSDVQCLRPVISHLTDRIHGKPNGQTQEWLLLWDVKSPHRNCKRRSLSPTARGVSHPTTGTGPSAYCVYRARGQRIRKDRFLNERHSRRQDDLKIVSLPLPSHGPCQGWLASGQCLAPWVNSRSDLLCALTFHCYAMGAAWEGLLLFFELSYIFEK